MIILGVHSGHNSSAALMIDGTIVGAVQEERFTKRKNQVAVPVKAARHLVERHLGGDAGRIGLVAFATREVDPIGLVVSRYSDFSVADHVREMHGYWRPVFYDGAPNDGRYWIEMWRRGEKLNADHNIDAETLMALPMAEAIQRMSTSERQRVIGDALAWSGQTEIVDHHATHAYYAFHGARVAPDHWADTLVLTADSWGDGRNWSAWTVDREGHLREQGSGADHGVARIYRFVTLILGMKPNEHEYKVMGLSSYSKSSSHIREAESVFYEALDFRDGQFVCERPLRDSYFDLRDRLEGLRFDNISAALQNWSADVTRRWVAHWLARTGTNRLCFSGGLSMNIKANGDLLAMPELAHLSVPASGGDETTSIGACFKAADGREEPIASLTHVYLGAYADDAPDMDWKTGLANAGASADDFGLVDSVSARDVARLLAADAIVARCVGPMEFGARALGNRSILANPSNPANLKRINDAIKNRDFWMPFTPSILEEAAPRYLEIPKGVASPFMTIGYQSTPLAREHIIAALHPGDFSARPQFVSRLTNPGYWELISAFESETGIGALLNTSLNLHGDPMNATVADAVRTLVHSALEFLLLPGGRLLYKKGARSELDRLGLA